MSKPNNFYLIAGVNGAGKSTFANTRFARTGITYFNPDEVQRRLALSSFEAGRLILEEVKKALLEKRGDVAVETTLAGQTHIKQLVLAKQQGYLIHLLYVGLNNVEAHLARIRQRVLTGGHDIPEVDVRRRYRKSLWNLKICWPVFDTVEVYDNSTESMRLVALAESRGIIQAGPDIPDWLSLLLD